MLRVDLSAARLLFGIVPQELITGLSTDARSPGYDMKAAQISQHRCRIAFRNISSITNDTIRPETTVAASDLVNLLYSWYVAMLEDKVSDRGSG